jgi:large subunit ribosomal protein L29
MKIDEIRSKNDEDLSKELDGSYEELMNLRFRWAARQLQNVYEMRKVQKKIARIKTVLTERE